MATAWTYTTLKIALKAHVEDQGTNFDAQVDNLIKLGEDRIVKDLPLSIFDGRSNVSIAQGVQTASKPAGALVTRAITYTDQITSKAVRLVPRSYGWLRARVDDTTQRTPKYFADDYSETQYWFAPNPNLTVTAEGSVTARPASIVSATTTFIGTNLGDLLLAACAIAAERFNLGWDESKDWMQEYAMLVASARVDLRELLRRDNSPLAPMPSATGKGEL